MLKFFKSLRPVVLTESDIRHVLKPIKASGYPLTIQILPNNKVIITIEVNPTEGAQLEDMRHECERAVLSIKGVSSALVILTAEREAGVAQPSSPAPAPRKNVPIIVPYVKQIIAVSSGKGGVGKSTVAANIAVGLSKRGLKIGIMDGDIYGPSVPRLFGLKDQKPMQKEGGAILPIETHGIKIMSMGFLVAEDKPMIWRGPIVQSAITQLLRDVEWGTDENPLDILVIDMPPGTGDAHLTLAQKVTLAGAVIVSTPQDLALIDARKGLEMYRAVAVPMLGIVENMSYYCCPQCGHKDDIFGHGGARREAEKLGVPFLGEVPLNSEIRSASDRGEMVTEFYNEIIDGVLKALDHNAQKPFPKIVFE